MPDVAVGRDRGTARRPAVDRLIVHQFDPRRPSPGGIDTCLRGMLKYQPAGDKIAVVGVDATLDPTRPLGRWETHDLGGGPFRFMPVTRLDPADQARGRIPHSVRLVVGFLRHAAFRIRPRLAQTHRADVGAAVRLLTRCPVTYFVHTQEGGLSRGVTDSIWSRASAVHERIEEWMVRGASSTVVFNEEYATTLQARHGRVEFSPTWFDGELFRPADNADAEGVVWVGRLEAPKNPQLAVAAFAAFAAQDGRDRWTLTVIGDGTELDACRADVAALPADIARRITLAGRLTPVDTAAAMRGARIFLMTSQPGYEGFPRVLVEALASGLPAAVTPGSDTGGLITGDVNGAVSDGREPRAFAEAMRRAAACEPAFAAKSVAALGAEDVVGRLYRLTTPGRTR